MRRLIALVLATLSLTLAGAAVATAQADGNAGTLSYSGPVVISIGGTETFTWDLECADGVCQVPGATPELIFTNGVATHTSSADFDDGCTYTMTAQRDLTLTPTGITGTTTYLPYDYTCTDGTSGADPGFTYTYDLAYVSGETCLIDASCAGAPVAGEGEEPTPGTTGATSGPGVASHTDDYAPGGDRPIDTPTVLSSVPTVAEAVRPPNLAWAAGGTAILGLLMVLPSQFLNSAIDTLVGRWRDRLRKGRMDPDKAARGLELRGWPWAAGGVFAASVIAAFVDPNFGFDAAGLRVFVTILATFAIEVVLGWLAVVFLVKRTHPEAVASFSFAPVTLLIVVGAVLFSRLSGFAPAIVFGLVAGVAFGGLLGTAAKARVALVGLGWAFGLGVVAWVVYSFLPVDLVIVREFLAALTIAGISALPIALLPLTGFVGRDVWEWRKVAWLVAYAIGLFAFLLVLLPLPGAWTEVGVGLWTWVALFLLYALTAVGLWLIVTRPWKKEPVEPPQT